MTTECEKIEQHLKALLFAKDQDNPLNSKSSLIQPNSSFLSFDTPAHPSSFPHDLPTRNDLIYSNHTQQNTTSTLIDNAALLRFASEHIEDVDQIPFSCKSFDNPINQTANSLQDFTIFKNINSFQCHDIEKESLNDDNVAQIPTPYTFSACPDLTDNSAQIEKSRRKHVKSKRKRVKKKDGKDFNAKAEFGKRKADMQNVSLDNDNEEDPFYAETKEVQDSNPTPDLESAVDEEIAAEVQRDIFANEKPVYLVHIKPQNHWNLFCDICDYNLTGYSLPDFKHLKMENHQKQLERCQRDLLLASLPDPLPAQVEAVTDTIMKLHQSHGLTAEHLAQRKSVGDRVNKLISANLPDCSVQLIGSSVSGCGLRNSEVDMVLLVKSEANSADRLSEAYDLIKHCSYFEGVQSQFQEKIPKIQFVDPEFKLTCSMIINSETAQQMTSLLAIYPSLDARVPPLMTAIKHFAQLCSIDKPDMGTLPAFAFPIILIYFLQRQNPPILPVVQEDIKSHTASNYESYRANCNWNSENLDSIGLLWLKLLKFYCFEYKPGYDVITIRTSKSLTCSDKNWGTTFIAIEDPLIQRNLAHIIPNRAVFKYLMDCFFAAYRYFGHPQLISGGPLNIKNSFISIDVEPPLCISNDWSTDESADATESIEVPNSELALQDSVLDFLEDHDADLPFDDVVSTICKMTIDDIKINDDEEKALFDGIIDSDVFADGSGIENDLFPLDGKNDLVAPKSQLAIERPNTHSRLLCVWDTDNREIKKTQLKYEFKTKYLKPAQNLPLVCRICSKSGHLKANCPDEILPPLKALPPMPIELVDCLDEVCHEVMSFNQPSKSELKSHNKDQMELQSYIREIFPDAELELFGSYCNGFGFSNSDLDFCLTFKDNKDGKNLDTSLIIEALATKFKEVTAYMNVIPIVSAKVPIVKFVNSKSGLECDISLYNTLAKHNTRMLQTYCKIDRRVKMIGYVIKHFAKVLDICDASRGSLSSYAYILMALFFLQQRKPPVIPVLQELYSGEKPTVLVDGWDVWFFDDVDRLKDIWPDYGKNKESVGALWFGLLDFYTAEFNMAEYVVSIRQKSPLKRFSKLWNSKKIAIEDPFDLNHNLGAGLSRKMNSYIMKALIYGREHFGYLSAEGVKCINKYGPVAYFFDRGFLNKGQEPPNDRGCRRCGKIGHIWKNCTATKAQKTFSVRKRDGKRKGSGTRNRRVEKGQSQNVDESRNNRASPVKSPPKRRESQPESDRPIFMDLPHESLPRHPMNRPSLFSQPPPGFGQHMPTNGLLIRNAVPFPPRPTASPFPSNSNNSASFPLPNVNIPQSNNIKPWLVDHRDVRSNNPHIPWPHPIQQRNHGLDQVNLRSRMMPGLQFPIRPPPANQERTRTNSDSSRYPLHKW